VEVIFEFTTEYADEAACIRATGRAEMTAGLIVAAVKSCVIARGEASGDHRVI
jgi:hypothetical protein